MGMKSLSEMDPGGTAGQVHLLLDAVDVLIKLRSHLRVAEDFIVAAQQIEKEEGQRNGKAAEHNACDCTGIKAFLAADIRIP